MLHVRISTNIFDGLLWRIWCGAPCSLRAPNNCAPRLNFCMVLFMYILFITLTFHSVHLRFFVTTCSDWRADGEDGRAFSFLILRFLDDNGLLAMLHTLQTPGSQRRPSRKWRARHIRNGRRPHSPWTPSIMVRPKFPAHRSPEGCAISR
jgi:hypothetical protein